MRRLLAGLLCVVCLACSDDEGSGPERVQIPGTYSLLTVNNQALPYLLININNAFYWYQTGGSVTLNADLTYREENRTRETTFDPVLGPVNFDTTIVFTGTYQVQDSAVLLTSSPGGLVSFGFVSGNRLTLSFEAGDSLFTLVYRRD
jgi:hypothetical protein